MDLPVEIIENILYYLLLNAEYYELIKYLYLNKYCYKIINQVTFKKIRYEINPNARDSIIDFKIGKIIFIINNGSHFSYNQKYINISIRKKYKNIIRRNLGKYCEHQHSPNNFCILVFNMINHYNSRHNCHRYIKIDTDNEYYYSNWSNKKFTHSQLYTALFRILVYSDNIRIK